MTAPYFVDANVLVYARDSRDARKRTLAESWMARLWEQRLGRTSTQVLSEYYVTVTRKLAPRVRAQDAWDDVTALFAWGPHPIDENLMRRAQEIETRLRLSWWDSMVVAAAQLQDCAILLTEDLQDGMVYGSVTVRSPFTLEVNEPAPTYAVPKARPLHPPRGRPRRAATG